MDGTDSSRRSAAPERLVRHGVLHSVPKLVHNLGKSSRAVQEVYGYAYIERVLAESGRDQFYVRLYLAGEVNSRSITMLEGRSESHDRLLERVCKYAYDEWHGHGSVFDGHLRLTIRVVTQDQDGWYAEDHSAILEPSGRHYTRLDSKESTTRYGWHRTDFTNPVCVSRYSQKASTKTEADAGASKARRTPRIRPTGDQHSAGRIQDDGGS